MTKLIKRIAIVGTTIFLGICSTSKAQAQAINTTQDFQQYCSKEALYHNMQSPDCDRVIEESWGSQGIHNLEQYLQVQQQTISLQNGQQLFADAQDAVANENYGAAIKLWEAASESFNMGGDQENARISRRNAIILTRFCRNYKNDLVTTSISRLFTGSSFAGMVNDFQYGDNYSRMCQQK